MIRTKNYFFKSDHKSLDDVTILQHHPRAVFYTFINESLGYDPLTLAQGQGEQPAGPEALIIGEFQQDRHGIRAGCQDEYQRDAGVRVRERRHQIEGRWHDVLTT